MVLETFALITHAHHGIALAALLHRGDHVARARRHLSDFIRDLLAEGAATGDLRGDVAPDELANATCTPWRRPATCRPRRRFTASSRSS